MTAAVRLGPNERQPCPSDARRRDHWAHGILCPICEPDAERLIVCQACGDRVTVRGETVEEHDVEGTGFDCRWSGRRLVSGRVAA